MTQTVQRTDTMSLSCSRDTVQSAEESVGTVGTVSEFLALTSPLISTFRRLRVPPKKRLRLKRFDLKNG